MSSGADWLRVSGSKGLVYLRMRRSLHIPTATIIAGRAYPQYLRQMLTWLANIALICAGIMVVEAE